MINDPPDSAARFAAWRSARADESEKSTGTNMRRGLTPARRLCVDVFVFMLLISAWQSWPAERRLLTPLHGAKQHATPTLAVPGPSLVAGEFRRRSDRFFVGWPFRTSSLPEFPSQAQRWRLLFVSTEILRSRFFQVALKILLNLLRISCQWQRSFISQSARFIRRPVGVKDRGFEFPDLP